MKLRLLFLLASLHLPLLGAPAFGRSPITEGEPDRLDGLRSLGDVISDAKKSGSRVHVIYVHGMRAEGPGASEAFRARLVKSLVKKGRTPRPRPRQSLELGPWPERAAVRGQKIWDTSEDWKAGQPFVDRYVLITDDDVTITIDEVNWWPLLFPLKCRILLLPEARLAGADKDHLGLCAKDVAPFHRWISKGEHADALKAKPALGGAAKANKYLKQQILDWGMSDAVIVTGPMQFYVKAAMEKAFEYAAGDSSNSEYVVISESLGSFAVLDSYGNPKSAVRQVMDSSYSLYFFANQFSLLELARITNLPVKAKQTGPPEQGKAVAIEEPPSVSPISALETWASASTTQGFRRPPISAVKQIIAFSDPSDALTFRVPCIEKALVANAYVRNAGSFLGLAADPVKAHSGHMKNSTLWKAMLKRSYPEKRLKPRPCPVP